MFGIGSTELIVIMILVIIFLGPKKLPDLAKAIGKALRELRRAQSDIHDTLHYTPPTSAPESPAHVKIQPTSPDLSDSPSGSSKTDIEQPASGSPSRNETPHHS